MLIIMANDSWPLKYTSNYWYFTRKERLTGQYPLTIQLIETYSRGSLSGTGFLGFGMYEVDIILDFLF
jgi:hypothetical protein